jgi:PIN domain nuclease of toxin-antitoxin system
VDVDVVSAGLAVRSQATDAVILLDTNAVIWLHRAHRRSLPLRRSRGRLYLSPASLLEIQFLAEADRVRLRAGAGVADLVDDARWLLDDPPAALWFSRALDLGWTRDPFDRLLVAHARLRGWRLATGDGELISRLGPGDCLEL